MKQILQRIYPEIVKIRHRIHANPELAHNEKNSAALVADTLRKYGYDVVEGIGGTGVSAVLDSGNPGKTVALRADMDALPIQEETNLDYQSKNKNVMHACGHDGHTATLLATAGTLIHFRGNLKGKIKFIFQPAEETGTGAAAMIKAGILDAPKVDAIFGYHNTPRFKTGVFATKVGCIHASQDTFTIVIKGKSGHAAQPHLTIDPIYIGSLIVQALQSIVSRLSLPTEPIVLSVTQFHSGTTHNVIPDEAMLNGTIRTLSSTIRELVKQWVIDIVNGIVSTFHATATIDFAYSFPPTSNYPNETKLAIHTAKHVLGEDKVECLVNSSMASEDFSYYLEKVPGCYFWIGTGYEHLRIHSATYEFNDEIIPLAAEVMGQIALNYLNSEKVKDETFAL